MRDLIFIGWSGDNELAIAVKKVLDRQNFQCIVGGDYENNPELLRTPDSGVYSTVVKQMRKCNQAIILFSKKHTEAPEGSENAGSPDKISGNLLFEAGYLYSKFNTSSSRVHIFKIDIYDADRKLFPSDMDGIWGVDLRTADLVCTPDADEATHKKEINALLAEKVVSEFMRKQNHLFGEKKLYYLNHYRQIENEMRLHLTDPVCSDYEMALHILFYSQAIYIYKDIEYAIHKCNEFLSRVQGHVSEALVTTGKIALCSLNLFRQAVPDNTRDGHVHMPSAEFFELLDNYEYLITRIIECFPGITICGEDGLCAPLTPDTRLDRIYLEEASDNAEEELAVWAITQVQEHVNFLYLIYLDNPDISEEEKVELAAEAIDCGNACIHNCLILKKDPKNIEYIRLLLGFIYKNMSTFSLILGDTERHEHFERETGRERSSQYMELRSDDSISPDLKNFFCLEYYSQVICDVRTTIEKQGRADTVWKRKYSGVIEQFINEFRTRNYNRMLEFNRLAEDYENIKKQF